MRSTESTSGDLPGERGRFAAGAGSRRLDEAAGGENPRQARDLNVDLDAGEAVQQGRLGAVLEHHDGPHALSVYAYTLYRDFDSRQPIPPELGDGVVDLPSRQPGRRLALRLHRAGSAASHRPLTVGLDAQGQDDDRRRFANVDGRRGALGVSEDENVRGLGTYVREAIFVTDDVQLSGGVRYDDVHFAVDVVVSARRATSRLAHVLAVEPGRRRAVGGPSVAVDVS